MALVLSLGCRDGLANTQGFSEMFNGGTLGIYDGASPGVEYGVTGSLLASVTISFASAGTGLLSIQQAALISNTGTAGYFRMSSPDDTPGANANGTAIRAEGTCSDLAGDDAEFTLSDLAMTAGKAITIRGSFQIPQT